ncbi:hypothetical protein FRB94_011149 [Tulasnella sp. JGI-2019a]|nr:hypothetical protein FRB94_011149 [Tulasnella sp. JGI-2019a]KAG9004529.1 hypothetical protein FRB93_010306 [Tulasnella sp. JGI-2019a]KAG9034272.1 hypothetical protein FRB95_013430 [Tulasnella sp. JGI-2019a]
MEDHKGEESVTRNVLYVVSEELAKVSSLLPSNRGRSALVHSLVSAFGLLQTGGSGWKYPLSVVRPTPATKAELLAYHDKEYLDMVLKYQADRSEGGGMARSSSAPLNEFGLEDDCPLFEGLAAYVQLVAGATLTATRALRDDQADVAICWDGGRHHAHRSRASGFCYVADIILSVLTLKKVRPRPRIMYLDLDLHFCDAVSQAFSSLSIPNGTSPNVLVLSIHHADRGFFPATSMSDLTRADTPDPYTLSIPLARGASNDTYARVWSSVVEPVREAFQPDYLFIQCGADGLAGDPCAVFNWTVDPACEGSMGWCVERALGWGCRTLLLGGGGYNSPNTARAWTLLTSIAVGIFISSVFLNALRKEGP